jgi:hypothetical protein
MNDARGDRPAEPPVTHLLYLHGFRSSPQSTKARQTQQWLAEHHPEVQWLCPQLPPSPREAFALVTDATSDWPLATRAVIGSSLGGYYATAYAERTGCRAVLLNPAVDPARDLARYIGEISAWHSDERFYFRAEYIAELRALHAPAPSDPQRCYAVIAKGDEVLDWREMHARYAACRIRLLEGGDHALSDYETAHLPSVLEFLRLRGAG